ncbi:MAG: hypothetical protein LBS58_01770, partial [Coriobacteriales bacterium]|nr:hypothetical protein [Coriobacteriales bacterium]
VNITNPPATIINQAGGAVERIVETVREFVLPSAEEPAVTLPDVDVPLTTITPQQTWSLLNLLFSLIGIALVIVTMIIRVVRKDKKGNEQVLTADQAEEEKKHANSQRLWLIGALAFAVVSLLLFAFTSPTLDYKMVLSNDWTVLHGVLFVLTFIASILVFRNTGNKNASEEAQIEAY